jgi:hypothetical protein
MMNDSNDKLMADAARLPRSVAPRRDLWPGIEAAIAEAVEPPPRRRPWLAQAAAVLLLVAASSLITYKLTVDEADVSPVANGGNVNLATASFGGEYQLGADYRLARASLQNRLDLVLERLSPEQRAEVEENLDIIQSAIAEINAALEEEPDNVLLRELLLDTYREELAVMHSVGGLTRSVMSRNDI